MTAKSPLSSWGWPRPALWPTNSLSEARFNLKPVFLRPYIMGLPEELYCAMLEVGHSARRHKIPGPLAHTMIDIARKSLELWRQDERTAIMLAHLVLSRPINLRDVTAKLPVPVAEACWRLINLFEYLADLDGAR